MTRCPRPACRGSMAASFGAVACSLCGRDMVPARTPTDEERLARERVLEAETNYRRGVHRRVIYRRGAPGGPGEGVPIGGRHGDNAAELVKGLS